MCAEVEAERRPQRQCSIIEQPELVSGIQRDRETEGVLSALFGI